MAGSSYSGDFQAFLGFPAALGSLEVRILQGFCHFSSQTSQKTAPHDGWSGGRAGRKRSVNRGGSLESGKSEREEEIFPYFHWLFFCPDVSQLVGKSREINGSRHKKGGL
jgi:hypothetical protein